MSRLRARAAVAAVTTGTVAVSGMALAGCTPGLSSDSPGDDAAVTSPISMAGAIAEQAPATALRSAVITAGTGLGGSVTEAGLPATDISAPELAGKVDVGLRVTNPDVTVAANEPVQIGFSLFDQDTNAPIAGQLIKIQVKMPEGWTTFLHLTTDAQGFASYEARVLTTTEVTAVYDGTDAFQSAQSENVALLRVPAPAPTPALPTQASRDTARDALPAETIATPAVAPVGSSLGEKAVYLASLEAGKPYVYGAEGPYSFDCSGFTQYIFKNLGRTLPRTAEEQYNATANNSVPRGQEQAGDLIFFGTPGNIYHVGISDGKGKMWAAPRSGEVVSLREIWTDSYTVHRVY